MELIKLGEKTYYIKNNTNIGVYKINNQEVYLIDTGNDKDAGKKVLKIMEENNWIVKGIINTHSHADHIGGNRVIQDRSNCVVLAHGVEKTIIENPYLEPAFLYGGSPINDLCNKFLMAKESKALEIDNEKIEGLEYFSLKGHSFDMIGIKTSDDVYFLGDALISEETITKYHLFYLYDVEKYLDTLKYLETLKGKFYVVSHCEGMNDISDLIKINKDKIYEICDNILDICKNKVTLEDIIKEIFDRYNLFMNVNQYYLLATVIKAYISFLMKDDKVKYYFEDNKMFYSIN